MTAYYNDIDPNACAWLEELIKLGEISPGDVDNRSILDVTPAELEPYDQIHFFAGIGVWSYALIQAGWPDDRPVVTGSCPCQPWSSAGKRLNHQDDRDLWWAMFWHIQQLRPATIFGEQVASSDGLRWWDSVATDLEAANYATAAFDLPAAGVGLPHIRQRLFWVANTNSPGRERPHTPQSKRWQPTLESTGSSSHQSLAHTESSECQRFGAIKDWEQDRSADYCRMGNPIGSERWKNSVNRDDNYGQTSERSKGSNSLKQSSSTLQWLYCRDEKYRPIKSGLSPLVDGVAPDLVQSGNPCPQTEATAEARTMRIKGYGNAIVAPLATRFIRAFMEAAA